MTRVFGIEYNKNTELLHAVSGPNYLQQPLGFTFNAAKGVVFGDLLDIWEPDNNVFVFLLPMLYKLRIKNFLFKFLVIQRPT